MNVVSSSVQIRKSCDVCVMFIDIEVETVRVRDHVGYYTCDDIGNRTWYPDCVEKPVEGSQFVSIEQAYSFYVAYGKKGGFDVRKGGQYKAAGGKETTIKYFYCSREGLPVKGKSLDKNSNEDMVEDGESSNGSIKFGEFKNKQKRRKASFRCGCLASLTLNKVGNVYEVKKLEEGHNHPLVAEKDMIFMKNSRNMGYTKQHFLYQVSNANFGPAIGFRLMKQLYGGFDRVGVTKSDCKNNKKKISVFIGDRDAQMAVEKLLSRKLHSPGFYVNYYKGSLHSLPRVPKGPPPFFLTAGFIDIEVETVRVRDHVGYYTCDDNGNRTWYPDCVEKPVEGCKFVSIDQAYSFYVAYGKKGGFDIRKGGQYQAAGTKETTIKYFYCSREGLPVKGKSVDENTNANISEEGESSNGSIKFGEFKNKKKRRKASFRCGCLASLTLKKIGNFYEVTNFEDGHNHPLVAEKDMIFMKNSRNMGYTKQHFLYQVSNANFGPAIGFRLMKQLYGGFDRVGVTKSDCKNNKKKISVFIGDRDAQMAVEKLLSRKLHSPGFYVNYYKDLPMEQDASNLYTRTIFFDVQDEMLASYKFCIALNVVQTENMEKYSVRDSQFQKRDLVDNVYEVDFCKSEMKLHCSCNRYEYYGVSQKLLQKEFPRNYLEKRWLKNVKPSKFALPRINAASDAVRNEVLELYEMFESTVDRLVHDLSKLHIYKEKMQALLNQAVIDIPTVPKVNGKAVICSMLGVKEPEETIMNNPLKSKTKGTGVFSRMKPRAEVSAEELSKRRACGVCGEKEGHNSRTCPQAQPSKKQKQQDTTKRAGLRESKRKK
ncbi:FAR1 DNA binding domain-containing protein [Artemisia annua]|uniref:FAR1 DNA binding domain-containing protein n=1 Tax=Artemisia annua TaxID=35608 RepID=A0A2U1NQX7_ARTAN|nr:FAR1 DNA binding domain-containing protein [Artemisia annua]